MRVVSWNIRAGGGVRAESISQQLTLWQPDIVALSEFRGTPPSQSIALAMRDIGLGYQRSTANRHEPATNALLLASRWPLRQLRLARAPDNPYRWLHVNVAAPLPFALMAVHIPNRSTGLKYPFMASVTDLVRHWRGPQAMIIGDTNSGRIGVDEESSAFNRIEDQWLVQLDKLQWRDGFRLLHGNQPEYTWYSPNGRNGFRLDQAFVHPLLCQRLQSVSHRWGGYSGEGRFDRMSDHAALLLDFDPVKQ